MFKQFGRPDQYTYLGVPFYDVPSKKKLSAHFYEKGKLAKASIEGLIFKAKIQSISQIQNIFNSMVQSVVL